MASGGKDNPKLSSILKGVREASLTEEDKKTSWPSSEP
jgi:hypothetical protein